MKFFIVNRSLWVKICSNLSVVRTSDNWKLEFQSRIWNPAFGGLSKDCAYTFSIFVKLGESIFSALVESGRFFFLDVVDTNYWRHGYCLGLVVVFVDWKWSHRGGRVNKRQMFLFWSDEADRYFASSPWSWALRLLLGKIFWNRVLDIIKRCADFDGTRCGEDSQTRIRNCFQLGNVIGWIDKSLGCLEKKNTRDILCKRKKRRMLVSYWESFIINQA